MLSQQTQENKTKNDISVLKSAEVWSVTQVINPFIVSKTGKKMDRETQVDKGRNETRWVKLDFTRGKGTVENTRSRGGITLCISASLGKGIDHRALCYGDTRVRNDIWRTGFRFMEKLEGFLDVWCWNFVFDVMLYILPVNVGL